MKVRLTPTKHFLIYSFIIGINILLGLPPLTNAGQIATKLPAAVPPQISHELFSAPIPIDMPNASYKIYAVQLFGDDRPELLISQCDDAGGETFVVINSDFTAGKFQQVRKYRVSCPASLVSDDFNGDKIKDIVGVSADGQGPLGMFVLYGNTEGSFSQQKKFLTDIDWKGNLYWSDLNHDMVTDLVAPYTLSDGSGTALKFISGKDFSLQPTELGIGVGSLRFLQYDDDSFNDLMVTYQGKFQWMRGDGNFGFTFSASTPIPPLHHYKKSFRGDIDEDGRTDVLISYQIQDSINGYGATFFFPPTFHSLQHLSLPGPLLAVQDFDNDGHLDLLTFAPGSDQHFWLVKGRGNGRFDLPIPANTIKQDSENFVLARPSKILTGDFNGDGKKDLLTLEGPFSKALLWLRN